MSNNPTVAAIQMTSGMDVHENLAQAKRLLEEAAAKGAQLAVLPEMFPLLGQGPEFTQARMKIQENEGQGLIQDFLSDIARRLNLWIIGGTIPLASNDPMRSYAACLVFDEKGSVVARYDKLHLFDANLASSESYRESDNTMPGDKIVLVQTPVGKVGLSVCYDMRFPELYRELLNLGAEILAIPVAFTATTGKMHWDVLTRAVAIQNFCYVIAAGQQGTHGMGRQTHGNSAIISPCGQVLAQLENGMGVVHAQIDLQQLSQKRAQIPALTHQRILTTSLNLKKVVVSLS
jgi:deaminated glutathione amidase